MASQLELPQCSAPPPERLGSQSPDEDLGDVQPRAGVSEIFRSVRDLIQSIKTYLA
jgi:hypothetical protein